MTIFYTRKGDAGSSIIGKNKIKKTSPFTEALGELDELNSMTGVLKADKVSSRLAQILHQIQEDLFIIQANLAYAMLKEKRQPPVFPPTKTLWSEHIIDAIENKLKSPKGFVIAGTTRSSAWLDLLRARSRKVERSFLKTENWKLKTSEHILPYLNRLSSLFFALARDEAHRAGKKELHPKYK
jgi:cob(I)alamin adenosyltransferase